MKTSLLKAGIAGALGLSAFFSVGTAYATSPAEKEFLWYCESDEATEAQKLTVLEIYASVEKEPEEVSCKELDSHLRSLSSIDIRLNVGPITDLSPLTGLKNVIIIICEMCDKNVISTIPDLPELRKLHLPHSKISSLNGLERFKKLRNLDIRGFSFDEHTDLGPISQVDTLNLGDAKFSSLSSLSQLKNIKILNFSNPKSIDLGTLPRLTTLSALFLEGLTIKNAGFFDHLPSLRYIYFTAGDFTNLDDLNLPDTINYVSFRGTKLHEELLYSLPAEFIGLYLVELSLEDFSFLRRIESLSTLQMDSVDLNTWQPIKHLLPQLNNLNLAFNPIETMAIPEGADQEWGELESLSLESTAVDSLEFFKRVRAPNLTEFTPPDLETKTEANCPTTGVPKAVADFCKAP